MSFADLGLSDELLRAVSDAGYTTPTPIQKGAITPTLMGKDLIGIAQTGTGKTASFVLPMIDILAEGRGAGGKKEVVEAKRAAAEKREFAAAPVDIGDVV